MAGGLSLRVRTANVSKCGIFLAILAIALYGAGSPGLFAQGAEPRRFALVMGNSAYQRNALPNPANDARDFGALLAEAGFDVTLRVDLDLRAMESALREFSGKLSPGDTVLVFYAGHGVESGGTNYLIPVDNWSLESEGQLSNKAFPVSRILEEAATRRAGLAMLILDACRDNPFLSRSGAGSRGLSVMSAPPSLESLILYSTAPGTTAADGAGRNSVFMRSLLVEIQTPDLSVRDVFDRVGGAVRAATGGAQVPWLNSTPLSKPFIFFSGAAAEARAAALSAAAESELGAQRAKIAELEAARAKAKDEADRQKLDTELATARAMENAKKLESERLAAESARLAEERKKAEAAALARKSFEASEAARAAAMKDEAARLRAEYENLVRADDSAPEFLRQINALEKALKEIRERYEAIRRNGERGIAAVYAQKSEALTASLIMEPWENEREFQDRTKGAFAELESKKSAELASYAASIDRERQGQERDLEERLDEVTRQFATKTYIQGGSSISIQTGAFDRDKKEWPLEIRSSDPDFHFESSIAYNIAGSPDLGAAYRAFDAALKAGALAAEVEYQYVRKPLEKYVEARAIAVRVKDLTTGKIIVSAKQDAPLFYIDNEAPGKRLGLPRLALTEGRQGTAYMVNGIRVLGSPDEITVLPGTFTVTAEAEGYKPWRSSGNLAPGQYLKLTVHQEKIEIIEMVLIPGGSFMMGSNEGYSDEKPVHQVTVSSFMIGKYEVTQEQYQKVMGTNPSKFTSGSEAPRRPMEQVSWYDAVTFCNKLSELEGLQKVYTITGTNVQADFSRNGYRLPTEAEWEYAARGGSQSKGYTYSGSNSIDSVAWYSNNSGSSTHAVGTKAPNELGLYDMSGNVWEWCWDWYKDSYDSGAQKDPMGASSGGGRVLRGGCWGDSPSNLRSAYRGGLSPGNRYNILGFRLLRRP